MDSVEREIYKNLRKYFDNLIHKIMGPNYYTVNPDVFYSDKEAYEDMIYHVKKIKHQLKVYKISFFILLSIILIMGIYLIIK